MHRSGDLRKKVSVVGQATNYGKVTNNGKTTNYGKKNPSVVRRD